MYSAPPPHGPPPDAAPRPLMLLLIILGLIGLIGLCFSLGILHASLSMSHALGHLIAAEAWRS